VLNDDKPGSGLGDSVTVVLHHESGAASTMSLSEQSGRWRHPCDVRFGRDVVKILEAAGVFPQRLPEHSVQLVG
jgi:hypothetical protein